MLPDLDDVEVKKLDNNLLLGHCSHASENTDSFSLVLNKFQKNISRCKLPLNGSV